MKALEAGKSGFSMIKVVPNLRLRRFSGSRVPFLKKEMKTLENFFSHSTPILKMFILVSQSVQTKPLIFQLPQ